MPRRWYVVRTVPSLEGLAARNLRSQSFDVFFPRTKMKVKSDIRYMPLFPCYLFIRFDVKKARWRSIMGTRGVLDLLGASEKGAIPVRKGAIEEFIKITDAAGFIKQNKKEEVLNVFRTGDLLKIDVGSFSGMIGKCIQSTVNTTILVVTLLSRPISVSLPTSGLTPIKPASK